MHTYSQNYEDVIIKRFFRNKKDGFYIDVGAHDPEEISVTKLFYDAGWRGINIEPTAKGFDRFVQLRSRDINLQIGITASRGKKTFYEIEGELPSGEQASALSTFLKKEAENACVMFGLSYTKRMVKTDSLANVCKRYVPEGMGIDFLKIDTEGFERIVLQSADFDNYRPTLIVVEATKPNSYPFENDDPESLGIWDSFDDIVVSAGYENVYFDGLNRFYLANEAAKKKSLFMVPVGIFDGIDYRSLEKEKESYKNEVSLFKQQLAEEEVKSANLQNELVNIENTKQLLEFTTSALGESQSRVELVTKEKGILLECLNNNLVNSRNYLGEIQSLNERYGKRAREVVALRDENVELFHRVNCLTEQYNVACDKFAPLQRTHELLAEVVEELRFRKKYWFSELIERMFPFGFLTKRHILQANNSLFELIPSLSRMKREAGRASHGFTLASQIPSTLGEAWFRLQKELSDIQSKHPKVHLVPSLEAFMAGNGVHRYIIDSDWVGFAYTPDPVVDHVGRNRKGMPFAPMALDDAAWKKSEPYCRTLFVTSEYHAKQIRGKSNVPVHVVRPSLPVDVSLWEASAFCENASRTIIQADEPLSRYFGVHLLTLNDFEKIVWTHKDIHSDAYVRNEDNYLKSKGLFYTKDHVSVSLPPSREDRAQLLKSSIVFLHLYAPTTPSILFDCVASGTPLLINPQPSVVELLGDDYPLYFNHYREASHKAQDVELLKMASHYLRELSGRVDFWRGGLDQVVNVIDGL